jgi:S-sulfo-L-cysteine synthase (3-phospho-L-serine-dependent)
MNDRQTPKRWLVFVESNTTGTGRLFANTARRCGYRPVVLAQKADRYPYLKTEAIDWVQCDTGSMAAVRDSIDRLVLEGPVAGIFSSSEYFIEPASAMARFYSLPGKDPEALRACCNKWRQRQALESAGLKTPTFRRATSVQEAREALRDVGLPAILKPSVGSGSVGVKLCATETEAVDHAAWLLQRTKNERGMPLAHEILVEEYVRGDEFSVETLGPLSIGITRKHLSREPFFVETGHDFPAQLDPEIRDSITVTVQRALQCLGWAWGPAHTELRWTARGPVIIEINPRLAGGFIPEIVRLATGVDMIRETLKLVVSEQADVIPACSNSASIRFLIPSRKGTIRRVSGLDVARHVAGVTEVQLYRETGQLVQLENDFRDRIGHVISCSSSPALAIRSVETALEQISIDIEDQMEAVSLMQ